tara:strand:- start:401 stop:1156 length:756 start_codon:yes stop_codon:yes gene_type:complete
MSNAAKNQMSFPGGMPGPGNYGSMDNKIVGKGMMKYLAGESVGMKKYGQHKGPEKALVGKQENLPEALKAKIEAAPGMYGKKKKGMKQMGEMEEPPMSGGPSKYGKHKGPKQEGDLKAIQSPRQKRLAKEKADEKKKNSDFLNKPLKFDKFVPKKKKAKSDMQKIKASKKAKIESAKAKKAEGQSDLKKARETKFVSRGSGEDSELSTRKDRRTAIRAARQKKREGKKAERKARKGTVIKQKNVRQRKADD